MNTIHYVEGHISAQGEIRVMFQKRKEGEVDTVGYMCVNSQYLSSRGYNEKCNKNQVNIIYQGLYILIHSINFLLYTEYVPSHQNYQEERHSLCLQDAHSLEEKLCPRKYTTQCGKESTLQKGSEHQRKERLFSAEKDQEQLDWENYNRIICEYKRLTYIGKIL